VLRAGQELPRRGSELLGREAGVRLDYDLRDLPQAEPGQRFGVAAEDCLVWLPLAQLRALRG
jgi:hypothetical protein